MFFSFPYLARACARAPLPSPLTLYWDKAPLIQCLEYANDIYLYTRRKKNSPRKIDSAFGGVLHSKPEVEREKKEGRKKKQKNNRSFSFVFVIKKGDENKKETKLALCLLRCGTCLGFCARVAIEKIVVSKAREAEKRTGKEREGTKEREESEKRQRRTRFFAAAAATALAAAAVAL